MGVAVRGESMEGWEMMLVWGGGGWLVAEGAGVTGREGGGAGHDGVGGKQ